MPFVSMFHGAPPSICGRILQAEYTPSSREKAASKETQCAVVVLLGPALCVVEGAGTITRGRSLVGILRRYRARAGGGQGLGREFVVRGKTKIWNGEKPAGCDALERKSTVADLTALPSCRQGSGNSFGAPVFRDSAAGDAHGRTPDVVVPLSIGPWLLLVHCAAFV